MSLFACSYKPQVCFRPDRFNPVVLAETKNLKVILACFEAGQAIPVHAPNSDLTATVLEGAGILTAGSEEHQLVPSAWAFVPAGEPRGIRAETTARLSPRRIAPAHRRRAFRRAHRTAALGPDRDRRAGGAAIPEIAVSPGGPSLLVGQDPPQRLLVPQMPERSDSSWTIWLWSTKRFTSGP